MSHEFRTHYEILGITRNAKNIEVERAYRKLRAQMREETSAPDARRALLIQTAYEVLSDPARRESYDESLRAPRAMFRYSFALHRTQWIAGSSLVALLAASAWIALHPTASVSPRDPADILAEASLAVGRLQSVEISGATTDLGLAFALNQGALATSCSGLKPTSQLLVSFAQRKVPARVENLYEGQSVCKLAADGMGSWPLRTRDGDPGTGEKVYGVRMDATGQAHLIEGTVRRVSAQDGVKTIEVDGAAASQLAGGPLIDTQGRVLAVALGEGRYRPIPPQWSAEMRAPPPAAAEPPKVAKPPKAAKPAPKEPARDWFEERAHQKAKALKVPDDI